jgi:threonyl-tRNA synthetase
VEYAEKRSLELRASGFRVEVDKRSEKIGYKIREGRLERIPYLLIVGDKEVGEGTVSVRSRKEGDLGGMNFADFMTRLSKEVAAKAR